MKSITQEQEKNGETQVQAKHQHSYIVFVDDVQYEFDHSPVTGGEIMDAAGIPYSVGLIQIRKDGSQRKIEVDDKINLKHGHRFKKAPRFKRG